jgi:hypothetical protein
MTWYYSVLEARTVDTGWVCIDGMALYGLRGPVVGYRWSVLRWHSTTGSYRPGPSIQVEYNAMSWYYSLLEARYLGTGGVYSGGMGLQAFRVPAFRSGRVYCDGLALQRLRSPVYMCSNQIGHVTKWSKSPVFRYRCGTQIGH